MDCAVLRGVFAVLLLLFFCLPAQGQQMQIIC